MDFFDDGSRDANAILLGVGDDKLKQSATGFFFLKAEVEEVLVRVKDEMQVSLARFLPEFS